MVKLTEVEDEHFAQEKPQPSKHNVLLASDDEEEDDDYTDTGTSTFYKSIESYPKWRLSQSKTHLSCDHFQSITIRL